MTIFAIDLFSALVTSTISPLTGETNLTSGRFLSKNKTSPALTSSPFSTTTLGMGDKPLKLFGEIAIVLVFAFWIPPVAAPFNFIE